MLNKEFLIIYKNAKKLEIQSKDGLVEKKGLIQIGYNSKTQRLYRRVIKDH